MRNVIILRYGELYLKGNNKSYFEKVLIKNIKESLKDFKAEVKKITGRLIVSNYNNDDESVIIDKLSKIFGLVSLSVASEIDTDKEKIIDYCKGIDLKNKTFRVNVKRADKTFPIQSDQFARYLGGVLLSCKENLKVDLHNPEKIVSVDIRENGKTYIFTEKIECAGGMPVSTAGKGLLLLSGGIDSPVAGYMMSRRGMSLSALHFHSYPYTSQQAKEKVIELRDRIEDYCGNIKLYICSFTEIQEEIHKKCAPEYMITIMRRFMMRIAEQICKNNDLKAIITGESLGQVASQTIESMTSTNSVLKDIVCLRPLVGMDKQDIIQIATKIDTFETSILPYEDCCTVFLPKNPIIHPKLSNVLYEESKLDIELLIKNALNTIEYV